MDVRSSWRTLDRDTRRGIVSVCVADALVGVSFGAITVAGGLALWVPVAMSLLVFAGGAQFAAVGVVLAGGSPLAGVATGLILNARHIPFGFAVGDVLGGRWWKRGLGAHLMIDESVAFTQRQAAQPRRRAAFWACGLLLFVVWNVAVVAGSITGSALGDTDALGLDAAFPAVLLALTMPAMSDAYTRLVGLAAAAIALLAAPILPTGVPVLLALASVALAARVPRTETPHTQPLEKAR
jgi:4-azaleucine resistance transporter AzlC